jgi:hypothetical protein
MSWIKRNHWLVLSWSITVLCLLATVHMSRQYARVCTHIMNINDGLYESDAPLDTKNRAHYLANLCFINH